MYKHSIFGPLDALSRALDKQRSERKVIDPLRGVCIPENFVLREYTSNFRYVLVSHTPLRTEKWVSVVRIKNDGMATAYYDASPQFLPVANTED